jgi:hypothetical protein
MADQPKSDSTESRVPDLFLNLYLMLLLLFTLGTCRNYANKDTISSLMRFPIFIPPFQQVSPTFTYTFTPSETISPTLTATISPSLTAGTASPSPSPTQSPTSTIPSTQLQTASPTWTLTPSSSPTGTAFVTTVSPETPTLPPTSTIEGEFIPFTSTPTLIPFPTVSLVIPTPTYTPELYYLHQPPGSLKLQKGEPSLFQKIGRLWPLFVIFTLWVILIIWFVIVQLLDRR